MLKSCFIADGIDTFHLLYLLCVIAFLFGFYMIVLSNFVHIIIYLKPGMRGFLVAII